METVNSKAEKDEIIMMTIAGKERKRTHPIETN